MTMGYPRRFPALDAARSTAIAATTGASRQIDFVHVDGAPHLVVRGPDGAARLLSSDTVFPRPRATLGTLVTSIRRTIPDVPIVQVDELTAYDAYYYAREEPLPPPVVRVMLGDA